MKSSNRITLAVVAAFATAVAAGCQRNTPTDTAASTVDQNVGSVDQKTSQAAGDAGRQQSEASPGPLAENKAGDVMADAAITAKIKTAIVSEPGLRSSQISVNTANGIVTLSGSVDTQQSAERAAQVAQTVNGVKSVENQLSVKTAG